MKCDSNNNEEEEGEQFDFDSGDEVPEADRQAPGVPTAGDGGADATSAGDAGADATSGSSGESPGGPFLSLQMGVLSGGVS